MYPFHFHVNTFKFTIAFCGIYHPLLNATKKKNEPEYNFFCLLKFTKNKQFDMDLNMKLLYTTDVIDDSIELKENMRTFFMS